MRVQPRERHPFRAVLWIIVVLALVAVALEVTAKFLLQAAIAAEVRARDPSIESVTADVPLPVIYDLLAHDTLPRVTVTGRKVSLGPLTADTVTAVARGVNVNLRQTISTREWDVTHIDRIDLTVSLKQAQASAILPPGFSFVFGQGTVTLKGTVTSVTGRFELQPPARVVFALEGSLPPGFPTSPSISFPVSPLSTCVQGLKLSPGTLTVTCSVLNPPVDFLPHR
jgi:hypothetical protein